MDMGVFNEPAPPSLGVCRILTIWTNHCRLDPNQQFFFKQAASASYNTDHRRLLHLPILDVLYQFICAEHEGDSLRSMDLRDEDPCHDVCHAHVAAGKKTNPDFDMGSHTLFGVLRNEGRCIHNTHGG